MTYTVYRATNTMNGKQFVGVDSDWPTARMMHEGARGDTEHFHREIRKNGPQLFRWEAVLQTEDAKEANKLAIELGLKTMVPVGYNTDIKLAPEKPNQISRTAKPILTAKDFVEQFGTPIKTEIPASVIESVVTPKLDVVRVEEKKKGQITDEGRRKISEAVSRPVSIDGIMYRSITEACEKLDLPRHQVKMVLKGTNSVAYYRQKNAAGK